MRKTVNFFKISAAGNDFILIDNRKKAFPADAFAAVKRLCDRKFSIGADGLITLEPGDKADFRMVYYNSDGSRASMCGNGARSIARFANALNIVQKKMSFETDAGIILAEILNKDVRIKLGEPRDAKLDFTLNVEKRDLCVSFINTGVPHTVLFVDDAEKSDIINLGRMIRNHRDFAPDGTNVDFVQKKDEHTLIVRTYERGVEDETLACGTGVTASAIVAGLRKIVIPPVDCLTKGGYSLKVSYTINNSAGTVNDVYLEGPADISFKGEVEI